MRSGLFLSPCHVRLLWYNRRMADTPGKLKEKWRSTPHRPGVYLMKDRAGKVIYVGKSRKLKNRVSQYFQNSEKNIKTARMVAAVRDFEYFLCDTEMEALTLENTLIKQHNPKYNIRLKDAKSYPYIKITDEAYPRLIMTRKREKDKGKYFGPYSGGSTVFSIINLLQKTLGIPSCKRSFPKDIGRERPCLYYQMGQCSGVCTGKVSPAFEPMKIDDLVETVNHFRCIDIIIERATERLTESLIKELHSTLKRGTSDSRLDWFCVGDYKRLPNEVGGHETTAPEEVHHQMKALLKEYNSKKRKSFEDIIDLHQRFEAIHPFQDGNGRVGRLVMFKECLANGYVPFIITEDLKMFYYRGLQEWSNIRGYLLDTCLTAQDNYKAVLDYFKVSY